MWRYFLFIILSVCYFLSYASASLKIEPSDVDYYIHDHPSFSIIFNEDFLKEKKKIIYLYEKITYYNDIYTEVFQEILKEKPIYVFASSKNQISNAVTSSTPFLRVLFFPTGKITHLASPSWGDTLIAHEMAHIFQLGQTSNRIKYLKKIFKNSEVIFIPIPIFLSANLVMPLFLLEGHAVLNESLFAPGGRLYSGSTRALVFTQLKNKFKTVKQFTEDYLINLTEDTFSGEQQYAHGGYFFNSLLKKYDIKTINNFFKIHAEYFITPISFISVKSAFQKTFDTSFESLINHYVQTYLPLAKQQKKAKEKSLFHSDICPRFNKKNNEIFFLTSDLKSTPSLKIFNTSTQKWKKRKKVFSPGKVFKIENRYLVSSSHKINTTEKAYGLFTEGMHLIKKYKSQNIQDMYNDQIISIDTSNNINQFILLLNGNFYDTTSSPALFSSDGNIYYFKQQENQRVMYKNKAPIFQFKGFYGKPVEIDKDGTVYFTSTSMFGSSLFGWHPNQGIYRVSPSDTIIDAIKVSNDEFLICEIEPHFYNYKFIPIKQIDEQPVLYDYPFEAIYNSLSTLSNLSKIKTETTDTIQKDPSHEDKVYLQELEDIDEGEYMESDLSTNTASSSLPEKHDTQHHHVTYSKYSSLRHIQFNGIKLGLLDDPITRYNGIINIQFKDPLEYNTFNSAYQLSRVHWMIQNKYMNNVYRIAWSVHHIYKEGLDNFTGPRAYSYIHEFGQEFSIPVFKAGYWSSAFSLKSAISSQEIKDQSHTNYYLITEPELQFQYKRIYRNNSNFHRHFYLKASVKFLFNLSDHPYNQLLNVHSFYKMNLGNEFYTTPFINYKTAITPKTVPIRYFRPLNLVDKHKLDILVRERVFEQTNHYISTGIKFQKPIDTPLYFSRYPFSLRKISPAITGKFIQYLDHKAKEDIHFFEWTFGLNIGILVHHKIKAVLNLYYGQSHSIDALIGNSLEYQNAFHDIANGAHFGLQLQSLF